MNMLATIEPKSDQLNSDDLIGRTLTITVKDVSIKVGEDQPVAIYFEGDNDKPYKLCKSMRRVLVQIWGPDAKKYIGRSMTLYRDPKVAFGGMAVGGIRISHMSDIEADVTMALTASRANKKPYTVRPLRMRADTNHPSTQQTAIAAPPANAAAGQTDEGAAGEAADTAQGQGSEVGLSVLVMAFEEGLRSAEDESALAAVWNGSKALRDRLKNEAPHFLKAVKKVLEDRREEFDADDSSLAF